MPIRELQPIYPLEENDYSVFKKELEENPNIYFHLGNVEHINSVLSEGFKTAKANGKVDGLDKTYFAARSKIALANLVWDFSVDRVMYCVRFTDEQILSPEAMKSEQELHIYGGVIQPTLLYYAVMEAGFIDEYKP